jgi:hypothetical protein
MGIVAREVDLAAPEGEPTVDREEAIAALEKLESALDVALAVMGPALVELICKDHIRNYDGPEIVGQVSVRPVN